MFVASSCGGGGSDVALDAGVGVNDGGGRDDGAAGDDSKGDSSAKDLDGQNSDNTPPDDLNDNDQDGITVGDNCPGVFNPAQSDDDEDGVGNSCDDSIPIDFPCGFSGSAASEISGSGDTSVTTLCQPMMADNPPPPWVKLGEVLVVDDTYLIIDFTDQDLIRARKLGLESVVVDNVAGRSPADLAELRIERDPASALATADPEVLAEVRPEVLQTVPVEVLVVQSDRTLAALPDRFWINAPRSTIDAVGAERLTNIKPNLPRFDADAAFNKGLEADADLRVTTTTTTTVQGSKTTAPAGQDLSDG